MVQDDLRAMAKAWPELTELVLADCKTCFDAFSTFSEFHSSGLRTLELPLDFTTFASPPYDLSVIQKNKLQQLNVYRPTKFPLTLKQKIMVVRNLLTVSPDLKIVETQDEWIADQIQDIQELITGIRGAVAAK